MPDFHTCKVINDMAYNLQDTTGHVRCTYVADIKLFMPAEYILSTLLDTKAFGWKFKYINDSSFMPHLKLQNSIVANVQTLDKIVDEYVNITMPKYGL